MTNSKSIFNQLFALIALFVLTTLSISNVSAHTSNTDVDFTYNQTDVQFAVENDFTETASPFAPLNPNIYSAASMGIKIKIKIIIIVKKKKKGVVEAVGIRVPQESKTTELASNEILLEVSREGNSFLMRPLKGELANSILMVPQGFKVSKEVSLKLGSKEPFGLKATMKDIRVNSLGNFEIQD
ncbi:MAG: hypothetical protein R3E32_02710 [Chitinophagales bacterium]